MTCTLEQYLSSKNDGMATRCCGRAYVCATKLLPHSLATRLQRRKNYKQKRCWRRMRRQIKWNEALERVFEQDIPSPRVAWQSKWKCKAFGITLCVCVYDPAWQHRYSSQPYRSKVNNFAFSIVDCSPFFHSTSQWYSKRVRGRKKGFSLNAQILFHIFCSSDQLPVGILFCNSFSFPFALRKSASHPTISTAQNHANKILRIECEMQRKKMPARNPEQSDEAFPTY